MGKKPQRDPNAPKRNMSAYLLYQNAMREQFKALNPGMTFGQLAKYTSAMYSTFEFWISTVAIDIFLLASFDDRTHSEITHHAIVMAKGICR